jgi:hypothetical protein
MNERIAAIRAYLLKSTLLAAVILLSAIAPLYSQSDTVAGIQTCSSAITPLREKAAFSPER